MFRRVARATRLAAAAAATAVAAVEVESNPVGNAPRPVQVVMANAAALPIIDPTRDDGTHYDRALVFVIRDGRLAGEAEIDLAGELSADELAGRLPVTPQELSPQVADDDLPFASVVVPTTMARVVELERAVQSLLDLDYPAYEVILVDNRPESTSERAALHARLSRDPRVRVVCEARPGISAARNRGVAEARGQLVAFIDDDAVAVRGWLRAVAARFHEEPLTVCVSGPVLPAELETPPQIWFEASGSKLPRYHTTITAARVNHGRGLGRASFEVEVVRPGGSPGRQLLYRAGTLGMGANLSFRRGELLASGGFNEALGTGTRSGGGEDIEILARLLDRGGQVTFDPAVIVRHYHRRDLESSLTQMYGYGKGLTAALTALALRHPRHVVGLAYQALAAPQVLGGKDADRRSGGYPEQLAAQERRGLIAGPFAYLSARLGRALR